MPCAPDEIRGYIDFGLQKTPMPRNQSADAMLIWVGLEQPPLGGPTGGV